MFKDIKKYLLVSVAIMLLVGVTASVSYAKSVSVGKAKTDILLKDAKEDILKTFAQKNIITDYKLVQLVDVDKTDKKVAEEFDNLDQSPIGSTESIFYLKNDSSALIVLYKESDGTNVMKYAEKTKDGWKESESRKPGKPILDFDKIETE
ncbi:MAG TPA: hypothetical protein VN426_11860 [Syntrophomonadaceae bacterium]|nr:hypothetical protein [Syntrophomonadaceae bacterium]